ncbi:unnamed protein product [Caretta caretta]
MPFKLPFLRGWQEGKESDVNAVTFHPCRPGFKPEFHHKRKMPADWTLLYPDVLLLCFLLTIISTNLPGIGETSNCGEGDRLQGLLIRREPCFS